MNDLPLSMLLSAAPHAVERARRLEFAVEQLRRGGDESEIRRRIRTGYGVSRWTAWRTVEMARDIA